MDGNQAESLETELSVIIELKKQAGEQEETGEGHQEKVKGNPKESTHPGKVTEDGKVYDQSLLLALYHTVAWK